MMKAIFNKYHLIFGLALFVFSCTPDITEDEVIIDDPDPVDTKTIDIPEGFDYSTHQKVDIEIRDEVPNVKYDLFEYSNSQNFIGNQTYIDEAGNQINEDVYRDDYINKLVYSGTPKNGVLKLSLTLPTNTTQVYLRRKEGLRYSAELVNVNNNRIDYTHTSGKNSVKTSMKNDVIDFLYCVNGQGDLFQVDPLNGDYTFISEMPMGSWTAAIDQENLVLYSIGRSNPYPLMKYDLVNETWSTVANLGMGGPRLDYNTDDNLLYFADDKGKLFTIDPISGQVINQWNINGLHNNVGGDLIFDQDGTFYMSSFSGLYRLTNNGNSYDAARISADNLPYTPTSMTIDSNGYLWLADATADANLIIMDTETGGWEYTLGDKANNGTNFGRKINDLTTLRIFNENPDNTDSDGDGIIDSQDAFPDDAEKAFEVFTPSRFGTGTIAFEDLWPSYGDYDFNDVALNYKAIAMLNSDNLAVQLDFICRVKANGAGFTNGFGIELEGVPTNLIESVTGTNLTEDYITLNANGTEAGQQNAVIIFTDNQNNFLTETTVSIKFTQPINTSQLGAAPFNPFIIKNKVRTHEIHLPYHSTTDLGQDGVEIDGISRDLDGNYISDTGFPWAISIIHDFKVPKERVSIEEAYNYFTLWATSGGEQYQDWYKDNPGYRNTNKIAN